MPEILVTGATGFIGSHLCKRLVAEGHHVVGLSYTGNRRRLDSLEDKSNFKLRVGDIRDKRDLRKLFRDYQINTVFHLATQVPYGSNERDFFGVNSLGTRNLLEWAKASGVEVFINASSNSVYSSPPKYIPVDEGHPTQPKDSYGISKLSGEMYCKEFERAMRIIILRYSGVYGKYMEGGRAIDLFAHNALENKPITLYDGTQSTDFTYIDDVIQGTLLAWQKGKGIYNISSGYETNILILAQAIKDLTHSDSEIVITKGKVDRSFRFYQGIYKARRELGYEPHSLVEGLSLYLESIK